MVTGLPYGTEGRIQTQILKGLLFAPSFAVPAKDGKYSRKVASPRAQRTILEFLAHSLCGNCTHERPDLTSPTRPITRRHLLMTYAIVISHSKTSIPLHRTAARCRASSPASMSSECAGTLAGGPNDKS